MRKKVISGILLAVNVILLFTIVILVIKIAGRGPRPEEPVVSANAVVSDNRPVASENTIEVEPQQSVTVLVAIPNVTNSVNVRSGPSTDYERVGSAYADCEYEVIEIQSNGWTKLYYDDVVGYISSEYLIYKNKVVFAEDSYTYEDATDEDLEPYMNN